ncbi:MAG: glycosyltransferase [Kiritimatiellae bacterium]|nr:glycosyltransferase [Kiritimatiellia bacterium]
MKVSLVTAVRNAEGTISAAIASALSQKGVDLDYIVVDGASTDGTPERVRAAREACPGRGFRILSERDDGLYDAINKGIAMATGDVVGILNADDVFESDDTLAAVAAAFDDGVDAVYGDIRFVRGGRTVRYYSGRSWRPWMHAFGHMPPHPSVYIRRGLFERLGPYRTDYRISADFELMVRYFCRARIRTRYLPRCVVRMAPGGLSTSGIGATLRLNRENVRANRENGYRSCLAMMLPKYLFKVAGVLFPERGGGDGKRGV